MVTQQLHRLINELCFVLCSGRFITPAKFLQNLYSGRLTHAFIHSGQGNPIFGTTYPLTALSTHSRVTIFLAQFVIRFKQEFHLKRLLKKDTLKKFEFYFLAILESRRCKIFERSNNKEAFMVTVFKRGAISIICCFIAGCGNTATTKRLRDGYEEVTYNHQNLSEPSSHYSSLRFHTSSGQIIMVWPLLRSEVIVTNGLAVFVGMRAVNRSRLDGNWQTAPRLFAVKAPAPPLDITSEVLGRWALNSGHDLTMALNDTSPLTSKESSDGLSVYFGFNAQNWPSTDIHLTLGELSDIMLQVSTTGERQKDPQLNAVYIDKTFSAPK